MAGTALHRWWVKAALQGLLAAAPGSATLDNQLRRARGAPLRPHYFLSKWQHVIAHLGVLGNPGGEPLPQTSVVEVGTGWFPIVPLGLALHGASVLTIDKHKHLDARRVRMTMQMLSDLERSGQLRCGSTDQLALLRTLLSDPERTSGADLLEPLGIDARVADARDLTGMPQAQGAQLLVSNNTLEHIPEPVLAGIFAEFARTGAADAQMSHYIDLADHYAGFDPRVTEFHFLTLSPAQWRLANNSLGYQNRLRIGDYRRLLTEAGWRSSEERLTRRPAAQLERLTLVAPFDQIPQRELLVVKAHLVSRRV